MPDPLTWRVFLGISKQILDPENLSWERFGTAVDSPTFRDHQDSFWIDGIRNELDPDGVEMIQHLCLYKLQYKDTITTKETSKIIKASIYVSGIVYPMVAKYSLIQRDLWKESYTTKPNHSMRRFAQAIHFSRQWDNFDSNCSTRTQRMGKKSEGVC